MDQPKIMVAIRKRPLFKKEMAKGDKDVLQVKSRETIIVSEYKQKVDLTKFLEESVFNFDYVFNEEASNEEVYESSIRPLVDSAFQGAKVTCFAYGQTGSGKTHTMNGSAAQGVPGMYALGANDIFEYLANPHFRHLKARLSFYEIYCGKLYDLLNKRNELKLREDNKNNINLIGLEEINVSNTEEFMAYMVQGGKERITCQNAVNADSSRSHAILVITLREGKKVFGKISFIDLAGNERGADHMDMGKQTRIDGAEINKSLLSLKECIRALDQGKGHTPFRGSKLTMVLKDSFIGFCRTIMIGNVSPSSSSSENTLNTLRYADRVKQLRKPHEGVSKQEMRAKELMLPRQNKNAIRVMINNDDDEEDIALKREEAQREYGLVKAPKEDFTRKNSSNGGKMQSKTEQKSVSVNKNQMGGNLGSNSRQPNNMVNPPALLNNKGQHLTTGNKRGGMGMESYEGGNSGNREAPPGLNRYNSSQYGQINRRDQPMQVESHSNYYLPPPNNNNANNANKMFNNTPSNPKRQSQQPTNMNHSQNLTGNYSQLSMNSNVNPNMNMSHNAYQQGNNQQGNNQGNNQQGNNQSNYQGTPNCYQPGYGQQNVNNNVNNQYNQNNQPPQNNQPNYQNNQPNHPNQPNQANQPNQYNQYNNQPAQKNNFFQNNGPNGPNPPQNVPNPSNAPYELPENWEDMAVTVASSKDPDFTQQVLTQMNERLFSEEEDLIRNHSDSLRREIDIIKNEMSQLNEMEIDRSKTTSRGYVQFMQDSIEEKISLLEELREKLINFTYKLDSIEEIERKGAKGKGGSHIDDEQLLDDINY